MLGSLFGNSVELGGRYRLGEEIGRGGLGIVYRGRDLKLERDVALKFPRGASANPEIVRDLKREARVLARLQHPNIVAVYDVGESDNGVYLAMELITGTPMSEWLRESSRDWRDVLGRMLQAGAGLAAAHDAGVVHRDFKPSNVMLDDKGRVKVVDFGLARELVSLDTVFGNANTGTETLRTKAAGTPLYMAPEQFDGEVTAASDQFAFCTALYEGLCGELPWRERARGVTAGGREGVELDRSLRRRGVPKRVRRGLLRGMAACPSDRFPSMEGLLSVVAPRLRGGWRGWVAAGVIAVGGGMLVVARSPAPDLCEGVESRARSVLTGPSVGYEFSEGRAKERFEAFLGEWDEFERSTCRGRASRAVTGELLLARERCLDRLTEEFSYAFEQLASQADDASPDFLVPRMSLEACSNDGSLLLQTSEKGIDTSAQDLILRRTADADVQVGLGDEDEALRILERTHSDWKDAEGVAYGIGELGLYYGALLANRGEESRAREVLSDALVRVSAQWHLDRLAAELRATFALVLSLSHRDVEEAQRMSAVALAALEDLGRVRPRFQAELALARASAVAQKRDVARAAVQRLRDGIERYDPSVDPPWPDYERESLVLLVAAAEVLSKTGDTEGATKLYEQSIPALREREGVDRALAVALNNLGEIQVYQDPSADVIERLEEAAAIKQRLGDRLGAASSWMNAGTAHLRADRPELAAQAYGIALATIPEGHNGEKTKILYNTGLAHLDLSEPALAQRTFEEALELPREDGEARPDLMFNLHVAALQASLKLQDVASSASLYRKATELEEESFSLVSRAELAIAGCAVLSREGSVPEELALSATSLADKTGRASLIREAERCRAAGR